MWKAMQADMRIIYYTLTKPFYCETECPTSGMQLPRAEEFEENVVILVAEYEDSRAEQKGAGDNDNLKCQERGDRFH